MRNNTAQWKQTSELSPLVSASLISCLEGCRDLLIPLLGHASPDATWPAASWYSGFSPNIACSAGQYTAGAVRVPTVVSLPGPAFQQLCWFAVWYMASDFASLCDSFLMCQLYQPHRVAVRLKWVTAHEVLRIVSVPGRAHESFYNSLTTLPLRDVLAFSHIYPITLFYILHSPYYQTSMSFLACYLSLHLHNLTWVSGHCLCSMCPQVLGLIRPGT